MTWCWRPSAGAYIFKYFGIYVDPSLELIPYGVEIVYNEQRKETINLQIKEIKTDIGTTIPAAGATSEIGSYHEITPDYCKRLNTFCMCASGKGFVNVTQQMFSISVLFV